MLKFQSIFYFYGVFHTSCEVASLIYQSVCIMQFQLCITKRTVISIWLFLLFRLLDFHFFTVVFNVVLVAIVPFYFSSLVCLTIYQIEGMNKFLLKIRFNISNSFFIMKILKSI